MGKLGRLVGMWLGGPVGKLVGKPVGRLVGKFVGSLVGKFVGRLVGWFVGRPDGRALIPGGTGTFASGLTPKFTTAPITASTAAAAPQPRRSG
ncbi:hypothetical protein [Streptomyces noursei]